MKRLLTRLVLGCMLFAGAATFAVPQPAYAELNQELSVGTQKINPYNQCGDWFDLGCQIGVLFVYGIWFRLTNALAELTAYLADYFLWFSVQSQLYRYGDLMSQGWVIVRNFVNIGFIAALLWAGIQFIIGKSEGAKILLRIILSALLVNFSLFGARLIIDAGNITARAIYTQIKISGVNGAQEIASTPGQVQISQGIMNISNPQTFLFKDISTGDDDFFWSMLTMFFMSGILNIMLIFIFLSMAVLFLTRTVSLILLGILVPIPIIVDLIPQLKSVVSKMKGAGSVFSFENWLPQYIRLSMIAPVYCFFLYLIVMIQSGYSKIAPLQPTEGAGLMSAAFTAMLPTIITFMLIRFASGYTKDLAGAFGAMITDGITKVVGAVGGLALGGLTRAGSLAGGALGKGLQASAAAGMTPEARAAKLAADLKGKNFLQRKMLQMGSAADSRTQALKAGAGNYLTREATYDPRNIRNTAGFKAFSGSWAGSKLLAETGRQIITDVDFGPADDRKYNDRDTARLKEAEVRRAARIATINTAMDDHNAREQKRLAAERASRPPDKTLEAGLEAERKLLEENVDVRPTVSENSDKEKQHTANIAASKSKIKQLELDIKNADSPKARNDLRRQLIAQKTTIKKEEDALAAIKFQKDNRISDNLSTIRSDITAGEAFVKETEEELKKERKAIDELGEQLKALQAKSARAEQVAKNGTPAQKAEAKALKDKITELKAEITERESGERDSNGKLLENGKKGLKQKEEALKKRIEKNDKDKKIIETREARAAEIREQITNRSYMDKNDEAQIYTDELKSLKESYLKEKDPKRKELLLTDIYNHSAHMTEVRSAQKQVNPNSSFDLVMDQAILNQNDINKQVASHLVATDMIRDMKNSYANMGRAVAATIAGVATTAAAATLAASTPAMLAAISTGIAAGAVADKLIGVQNNTGENNNRSSTSVGQAIDKVNNAVNASQKSIDELTSWFNRSSSTAEIEKAFRDSMK